MKRFLGWLKGSDGAPAEPGDLLEQARALARAGELAQASAAYGRIKRKDETAEGLVEHAELLLELGDYFGAASRASAALERDPACARAEAVQREILRREREESARAARAPRGERP